MSERDIILEFNILRKSIIALEQEIKNKQKMLKGISSEYQAEWSSFIHQALLIKGLVVCTKCYALVPARECKKVICVKQEENSQNNSDRLIDQHELCSNCYSKAENKYSDIPEFISFMEEVVTTCTLSNGNDYVFYPKHLWAKINQKILEMPDSVLEEIAKQYNLPPKLNIDK